MALTIKPISGVLNALINRDLSYRSFWLAGGAVHHRQNSDYDEPALILQEALTVLWQLFPEFQMEKAHRNIALIIRIVTYHIGRLRNASGADWRLSIMKRAPS